ncbi:hypothetical protein EV363DRAFT_354488 [Boletus edulis]|nr:hypothetical protein EV363DRAFT_354488 [Boletus edulis]
MFPAASLLTTLLLALSIAATPVEIRSSPVTLPFAKRINTSGGAIDLVQHDQARAAAIKDPRCCHSEWQGGSSRCQHRCYQRGCLVHCVGRSRQPGDHL